jgi:hypothetical protein
MHNSKLFVISIIALLMLTISVGVVSAQYSVEKTTAITIGSDGTFTATEPDVGVSYVISGSSGATGSVTAVVYSGDPQAIADVPSGVSLTHFVAITFDLAASDFDSAQITLSYRDSDVANLKEPYTIYKYMAETDSYVQLPTTVDTAAKTLTVTLTSVDDPLLAIGGLKAEDNPITASSWIIVVIATIIIVALAVFLVYNWRRR